MAMTYQQPQNYAPPPGPQGHAMYGFPQGQSMHRPPQSQTQGQMHDAARFKISKPSFHSRYECKPDNAPDGPSAYSLEISKNPKKHPELALTAGGASVAACYFLEASRYYNSDSKMSRIGLGDPANVQWTEMSYRGKDKYGWSFSLNLPNVGQPVPLTWLKDHSVAVDGMSASRLSNNNFKLQDPTGQIMAINMDLGPMFEYAVITTLLSIYDFQKREEEKRSSSSSAAGAAAAASG
ncbi:hypothetical protein NW755_009396 [Fusarium falciforme]|uniref:Uncharacterized protein n=1 Tax=Fusarium falciforme TaxID=195108 RepID=A0A9W8R1L7_9HYPO|nr:hypothetical protein NW755_009396 [Fusarium falciforme]